MNQEKSTEPVQFQVVFEGKSKEGVDPEKAAEKLARTFRLPPESVQSLLSGRSEDAPGNPVTAALKPLAYAFVCLIFINLTAKPIALYFRSEGQREEFPAERLADRQGSERPLAENGRSSKAAG
ncbi:MAG: hypothetical protein LLF99_08345 [Desulfobacteraceae bacterium]|nr:hypothetical protein [Desulfobacteraceae bacterium]